ncbi:hypothetical protein EYZ11_010125 [Aspergillus tanneri]|uniref:RING-type E3 ubiquitin transferase n=1 Tax=Aspergillus tanneri TaxID=1220188 RepID=A0A4S3J636_9EURO|nr:hypothetical protein EYZ11_010125 [Aspergillus tanneri]
MSSTAAAASLTTAASLFAGPGIATNNTPSVNDSASFRLVLDGTVQTLSTQNRPDNGPVRGLFFVPGLDSHDPCINTTAPYIPANVTRFEDVDIFGYRTVGLAPWVDASCTQSFLLASQRAGVSGLVFFVPSSNDTKPPPAEDPTWSLGNGDKWKGQNHYPVYAIPGVAGATIMRQLSWYSGNSSRSENTSIESSQDQLGETRLFALIELEKDEKKMPSLWGFILAIIVQKRRRESLQRRIEAGEADVEHLGLHQVKVPQEVLDTLPVYTYPDLNALSDSDSNSQASNDSSMHTIDKVQDHAESLGDETETRNEELPGEQEGEKGPQEKEETHGTEEESQLQRDISTDSPQQPQSAATLSRTKRLSHSQTTCAICLDDFVPGVAVVRELPCGHLFHVACIDTSLTQISSLCPLCKKSVIPPGSHLVPVTNRMVHLDYMLRRAQ